MHTHTHTHTKARTRTHMHTQSGFERGERFRIPEADVALGDLDVLFNTGTPFRTGRLIMSVHQRTASLLPAP